MMLRVLIVVALVLGLMWWFGKGRRRHGPAAEAPPPSEPAEPQAMVRCAHCGVHLPRGDAVIGQADQVYCGEGHRLLGPGPGSRP